MPEQKLVEKYRDLDSKLKDKKLWLAKKIAPLIKEFVDDTGLLPTTITPTYLNVTAIGDQHSHFLILEDQINIRTSRG